MKTTREKLWDHLQTLPTGVCVEVNESIANDLLDGCTLRAIEYALTGLELDGLIRWHRKTRGGKRRPFYSVTVLQESRQEVRS